MRCLWLSRAGTDRSGVRLVRRGSTQPGPARLVPRLGAFAQGRGVVHTEDELDPLRPPVEVGGQREVGVPAPLYDMSIPALRFAEMGTIVPSTSR
jgi:hypothetical protein